VSKEEPIVRWVEGIQRDENGGRPIVNQVARLLNLRSGTILLIVCKKDLVSLLRRTRQRILRGRGKVAVVEIDNLLKECNNYIASVSAVVSIGKERRKKAAKAK
jgi:hypothetical protein